VQSLDGRDHPLELFLFGDLRLESVMRNSANIDRRDGFVSSRPETA
jgi:hypothetical protein